MINWNQLYIQFFYRHSLAEMLLWGVLITAFWVLCGAVITRAKGGQPLWIWINRLLLVSAVAFILWWTLFMRSANKQEPRLIPFSSFARVAYDPEVYRAIIANILLFVPLGLSLPFVLRHPLIRPNRKSRHPIRTTLLTAAAFSAVIEISQYVFSLGFCETDDVIFNTSGAALGALSYLVHIRLITRGSMRE